MEFEGINRSIYFVFAEFFEKQINKVRMYVIKI